MAEAALCVSDSGDLVRPVTPVARVPISRIEDHPSWPILAKLVVIISAQIPLRQFRVRDLLGLHVGDLVETEAPETEDVPLKAGSVQVAWGEFEAVDGQLIVRLTRLA